VTPAAGPWNRRWPEVAGTVRERIAGGTLEPGSVPSIARLCPELGVGRKTAARALSALEDEGLLERRPGIGYVVRARPG
jgi:DNA-binding GntR family transcriptional regulator